MPSALVTGGSSGIGLAIARMLRDEGYALTLAARTVERLEEAAGALEAKAIPVDVRHDEECARLVAAHLEAHGGLDVLVNSAGVGIAGQIGDTSTKQFDLQQSVNLRSAFLVTREALPALRESRGYVINLASIAGTIPTPGLRGHADGCVDGHRRRGDDPAGGLRGDRALAPPPQPCRPRSRCRGRARRRRHRVAGARG